MGFVSKEQVEQVREEADAAGEGWLAVGDAAGLVDPITIVR